MEGRKPLNPFKAEDFALMDAIEMSASDLGEYYAKLANCDIECQQVREMNAAHLDFVKKLKANFGGMMP